MESKSVMSPQVPNRGSFYTLRSWYSRSSQNFRCSVPLSNRATIASLALQAYPPRQLAVNVRAQGRRPCPPFHPVGMFAFVSQVFFLSCDEMVERRTVSSVGPTATVRRLCAMCAHQRAVKMQGATSTQHRLTRCHPCALL